MTNLKNQIKMLLIHKGITMTELVSLLNDKYGRSDVVQNLNNKITKETLRFSEILEIAEVLDYKIAYIPSDEKLETEKNGIFFAERLPTRGTQRTTKPNHTRRFFDPDTLDINKPSDE